MNCIKCYQEIPDGAKFCPYCGAQQSDTSATDPVRAEETVTGSRYRRRRQKKFRQSRYRRRRQKKFRQSRYRRHRQKKL